MKKILVVSDTHGHDINLKRVISECGPFEMLLHLGDTEGSDDYIRSYAGKDCAVHIVRGNNDYFANVPSEEEIMIGSTRALLTHGHRYNVSLSLEKLAHEAKVRDCTLAIYGHTHIPYLGEYKGITLLNPGSISYPRQATRYPTFAIIEVDEKGILHYTISRVF